MKVRSTVVDGLITDASSFSPQETVDRLITSLTDRGMLVVARIDHSASAVEAGLALRWSEVIIFGSPRAGSLLMQLAPTMAIDLPFRALVWQDNDGHTWLSFNDPCWFAERHGVDPNASSMVHAMTEALAAISGDALRS